MQGSFKRKPVSVIYASRNQKQGRRKSWSRLFARKVWERGTGGGGEAAGSRFSNCERILGASSGQLSCRQYASVSQEQLWERRCLDRKSWKELRGVAWNIGVSASTTKQDASRVCSVDLRGWCYYLFNKSEIILALYWNCIPHEERGKWSAIVQEYVLCKPFQWEGIGCESFETIEDIYRWIVLFYWIEFTIFSMTFRHCSVVRTWEINRSLSFRRTSYFQGILWNLGFAVKRYNRISLEEVRGECYQASTNFV